MEKELLEQILNEIKGVKKEVSEIKQDLAGVKQDLKELSTQGGENTKILRALEESVSAARADIKVVKKDITTLRENMNFVEMATVKNLYDISNLKVIK